MRLSDPDNPTSRGFVLVYDAARFDPTVETIPVTDTRMHGSWGDKLQRVVLTSKKSGLSDRFSVLLKVE